MSSGFLGRIAILCVIVVCLQPVKLAAHKNISDGKEGRILVSDESHNDDANNTDEALEQKTKQKEYRKSIKVNASVDFSWSNSRKLTWSDFIGSVDKNEEDNTAAVTSCGLGFETSMPDKSGNFSIKVYNRFFPNKSWVRPGQLKSQILAHEQCHFDICEVYTRILKKRLTEAIYHATSIDALKDIYYKVQAEYLERQQLYEEETEHGLVLSAQHHWENAISQELLLDSVSCLVLR